MAGLPAHTKVGLALAVTTNGAIVIAVVEVLIPHPFCPATVYVVVAVGKNDCPFVTGTDPPDQVYVKAPPAVRVAVLPKQMVFGVLVMVNTGKPGLTVTDIEVAATQAKLLVPIIE